MGTVTASPDDSGTTETNLSDKIPKLFNFLNELKEVGKNQYPGAHCLGVGGNANLVVYEHGNCTGIIDSISGNVKKVEMKDMVTDENTEKFLESLGFIEKIERNHMVSEENEKKFVESLSSNNFLITNSKWSPSSNFTITDEERIDCVKSYYHFLQEEII